MPRVKKEKIVKPKEDPTPEVIDGNIIPAEPKMDPSIPENKQRGLR